MANKETQMNSIKFFTILIGAAILLAIATFLAGAGQYEWSSLVFLLSFGGLGYLYKYGGPAKESEPNRVTQRNLESAE
jgi:uncharacterized ion transporter superfamily protein YfcC